MLVENYRWQVCPPDSRKPHIRWLCGGHRFVRQVYWYWWHLSAQPYSCRRVGLWKPLPEAGPQRDQSHDSVCGYMQGTRDRDGINPQFYSPWHIDLLSKDPPVLIVSDSNNNALRAADLLHRNVSTLPLASELKDPMFAMFDDSRNALFVSSGTQIKKVNLVDYSVENIAGNGTSGRNDRWFDEATFGELREIVKLNENVLVVADSHYDNLRVLDLQQESVRSILTGKTDQR